MLLGSATLTESPRWLVQQNRVVDARQALRRLREPGSDVDHAVAEIAASVVTEKLETQVMKHPHRAAWLLTMHRARTYVHTTGQ